MVVLVGFLFILVALVISLWIYKVVEALLSQVATISTSRRATRQCQTSTIWYRTKDGEGDYGFALERLEGGYRVYVVEYASEGAKRAPHLLSDRKGRHICWSEPIQTEQAALAVAAAWSDCVQRYLKTGQGF